MVIYLILLAILLAWWGGYELLILCFPFLELVAISDSHLSWLVILWPVTAALVAGLCFLLVKGVRFGIRYRRAKEQAKLDLEAAEEQARLDMEAASALKLSNEKNAKLVRERRIKELEQFEADEFGFET